MFSKSDRCKNASDFDEVEEDFCGFAVAGSAAPEELDFEEKVLDEMTFFIDILICARFLLRLQKNKV